MAIKTLHDEYHATGKANFLAEAEMMSKLQHQCIVHLIGVCDGPPLMLVSAHAYDSACNPDLIVARTLCILEDLYLLVIEVI